MVFAGMLHHPGGNLIIFSLFGKNCAKNDEHTMHITRQTRRPDP
jgi:hypothetical protein